MSKKIYIREDMKLYFLEEKLIDYFLLILKQLKVDSLESFIADPHEITKERINCFDHEQASQFIAFINFLEFIRVHQRYMSELLQKAINKFFVYVDSEISLRTLYKKSLRIDIESCDNFEEVMKETLSVYFDEIFVKCGINFDIDKNLYNVSELDKKCLFKLNLLYHFSYEDIINNLSTSMMKYIVNNAEYSMEGHYSKNIFIHLIEKNDFVGIDYDKFLTYYKKYNDNMSLSCIWNIISNKEYFNLICESPGMHNTIEQLFAEDKEKLFNILMENEKLLQKSLFDFVFQNYDKEITDEKHIKFILENFSEFYFTGFSREKLKQLLKNYFDGKYNINIDLNKFCSHNVNISFTDLFLEQKYFNKIIDIETLNIEAIFDEFIPYEKMCFFSNLPDSKKYDIIAFLFNRDSYIVIKDLCDFPLFRDCITNYLLTLDEDMDTLIYDVNLILNRLSPFLSSRIIGEFIRKTNSIQIKDFLYRLSGIESINSFINLSDEEMLDLLATGNIFSKCIYASIFKDRDIHKIISESKTVDEILENNLIYTYTNQQILRFFYENGISKRIQDIELFDIAIGELYQVNDIDILKYYLSMDSVINRTTDDDFISKMSNHIINNIYSSEPDFVYKLLSKMDNNKLGATIANRLFINSKQLQNDLIACQIVLEKNCNFIKYIDEKIIDVSLINRVNTFDNLDYNNLSKSLFIEISNHVTLNADKPILNYIKNTFYNSDLSTNEVEKNVIMCFLTTPIGADLIQYYEYLQNSEEAFIKATNYDVSLLRFFSNSLYTLDNLKKVSNLEKFPTDYLILCDLESLIYPVINNKLVPNAWNYITKKSIKKIDYSKITNTDIYNEVFLNNTDLFFQICYYYPKCVKYVKGSIKGYLNTFSNFEVLKLDTNEIDDYFDESGATEKLKQYFKDPGTAQSCISLIEHIDSLFSNPPLGLLDAFEYYIEEEYSIDKKKFIYLKNTLGPKLLFGLKSKNIVKFIQLPIEEINKFFEVVHSREANSSKIKDAMLDSMLQYEFTQYFENEIKIYSIVRDLLSNITKEELSNWINCGYTNINLEKLNIYKEKIYAVLGIDDNYKMKFNEETPTYISFDDALVYGVNGNLNYIHEYCDEYVKKAREKYAHENKDFAERIGFESTYDKDDALEKLYNYFLNIFDYENFILMIRVISNNINLELLDYTDTIESINMKVGELKLLLNITKEEFEAVLDVLINKKVPSEILKNKKSLIKVISKFIRYTSKSELKNNTNISNLLDDLGVEKNLNIRLNKLDYIEILKEIDFELFDKVIYSNEGVRNNLIAHFDKYYLGQVPNAIDKFLQKKLGMDLIGGVNSIGLFMMHYYNELLVKQEKIKVTKNIDKKLEDIKFSFSEIVKLISVVNGADKGLTRLIGQKAYNVFSKNASPNASLYKRKEREKEVLKLIPLLYINNEVTIPSKDTILEYNNKKINIIVGNRTNMNNLCHGERTGSCMRLGGAGESLFLKCLVNKNWFHIRLEDPTTHEYISRVSGFRNGNTVYLNQLRYSANPNKYSNKDLKKFIEIYSKSLIVETKTSEYPIENVFINNQYVMKDYSKTSFKLSDKNITAEYDVHDIKNYGLNNSSYIYTDVENSSILVATTEEGSKTEYGYIEIKSGPNNTDTFECVRDKILGLTFDNDTEIVQNTRNATCDIDNLIEGINKVHALKNFFLGSDYQYDIDDIIDSAKSLNVCDGFVSSDWYVFIDTDGNIFSDYIEFIKKEEIIPYHDKDSAQKELDKYRRILENRYELKKEKKM